MKYFINLFTTILAANQLTLTPDGTWVQGQPTLTPKGYWVGSSNGNVQTDPKGHWYGVYNMKERSTNVHTPSTSRPSNGFTTSSDLFNSH